MEPGHGRSASRFQVNTAAEAPLSADTGSCLLHTALNSESFYSLLSFTRTCYCAVEQQQKHNPFDGSNPDSKNYLCVCHIYSLMTQVCLQRQSTQDIWEFYFIAIYLFTCWQKGYCVTDSSEARDVFASSVGLSLFRQQVHLLCLSHRRH